MNLNLDEACFSFDKAMILSRDKRQETRDKRQETRDNFLVFPGTSRVFQHIYAILILRGEV